MATQSITPRNFSAQDAIFDDLAALISAQAFDWRPLAYDVLGKLLTGVTIGLGIAVGLALAG